MVAKKEEAEFAGQSIVSENYIVSTDDYYGVGVVRIGKVGGVADEFVIPAERLEEVIEQLGKVKL